MGGACSPGPSGAVPLPAGVIDEPAVALDGCTENTTRAAAPAAMLNGALGTGGKPLAPAVSVYPVPILSMLSVENVATPLTAATVVVPDTVPPLALVPNAAVTVPLNPVPPLPSPP